MRTFQNKGIPVQLHLVVFNTSLGAIGVLGGSGTDLCLMNSLKPLLITIMATIQNLTTIYL